MKASWSEVEPNPLVWGWHLDAIAEHLQAITSGQIRDLVIAIPPGLSKSLSTSTFWPAWVWGPAGRPQTKFLCATHGQSLSEKNARLHRDLVKSAWYQERWGDIAKIGKDSVDQVREFRNTAGGWRFSTSVEGDAIGRHADVLLFDDLAKTQEVMGAQVVDPAGIERANRFWFEVMYTRRSNPLTTARVGIAQRLHHDDTVGKCIERGYSALVLPMEYDSRRRCSTVVRWTPPGGTERAPFEDPRTTDGELLAPARFPREVVDEDKRALGPIAFEAQNQQNPSPATGAIFENLHSCGRWSEVPEKARRIITVDCAFKDKKTSDFVAIQVWAVDRSEKPLYYLEHQHLERLGFGATLEAIREVAAGWPRAAIYVEDKANGPAIVETLQKEIAGVQDWSPGSASKVSRAEAVAHLFKTSVRLPPDIRAPWIGAYITTMHRFPYVKNDDSVDATTMALLILHAPERERWKRYAAATRAGIR